MVDWACKTSSINQSIVTLPSVSFASFVTHDLIMSLSLYKAFFVIFKEDSILVIELRTHYISEGIPRLASWCKCCLKTTRENEV